MGRADQPAIRVVMMPRDTNHQGNIFGGVILAYIDQAGFVEAKKQAYHTYVTVSVDRVDFLKPIFIGDTASFYTQVAKVGTSSITIDIKVFVEAPHSHTEELTTTAKFTYVAIDERTRRSMPIFADEKKSRETKESSWHLRYNVVQPIRSRESGDSGGFRVIHLLGATACVLITSNPYLRKRAGGKVRLHFLWAIYPRSTDRGFFRS